MDLGDIGKMLDNTPMDKVGDVVDFFLDHRDELDKVIAFVRQAPALIGKVGDALGEAGDHAKDAAVSLVGTPAKASAASIKGGPGGTPGKGGAAATLISGAGTLGNVGDQLAEAADFLGDMATFLAKVEIPNIETKFTKVAGVNIVSGIDIGKDHPLEDPAKRLASTAVTLGKAKGDLAGLADNLESLAHILTAVGGALDRLGDGLKDTGSQAAKLFD